MADLILPGNSRHALALREPALLVPGRVPSGIVGIADRWAKYRPIIVLCPQLALDNGLNSLTNFVSRAAPLTTTGTATTASPYRARFGYRSVELHPSGGASGMDMLTSAPNLFAATDDLTVVVFGEWQTTTAFMGTYSQVCYIHQQGSLDNDGLRMKMSSATNFEGAYIDGTTPSAATSNVTVPSQNQYDNFAVAVRKFGVSAQSYFAQNRAIYTGAVAANDSADFRGADPVFNFGYKLGHYRLRLAVVFRSDVPDAALRQLLLHEYSLFEPANSTPYLFPIAGGGTTLPTLSDPVGFNITSSGFQPRVTATYS